MVDEVADRFYSTGEIVLVILIVTVVLTVPVLAGMIYYFRFM